MMRKINHRLIELINQTATGGEDDAINPTFEFTIDTLEELVCLVVDETIDNMEIGFTSADWQNIQRYKVKKLLTIQKKSQSGSIRFPGGRKS